MKLDRLTQIEVEVYHSIDRMCLTVGALLFEAQQLDQRGFGKWVERTLPFGVDKAKRLIAIHLAYAELPAGIVEQLPRPWQALYALRQFAPRLPAAIAAGEIGPSTTVEQSRSLARKWSSNTPRGTTGMARYRTADTRAGDLMGHSPAELSEPVLRSLRRWLDN